SLKASESSLWSGLWSQSADASVEVLKDKTLRYGEGGLELGVHAMEIKGSGSLELTAADSSLVLGNTQSHLKLTGNGSVPQVVVKATHAGGRGLSITGQPSLAGLEFQVDSSLSATQQFSVDGGILISGVKLTLNDSGTFANSLVLDGGTLEVTGQLMLSGVVSQQAASKIKLAQSANLTTQQAVDLGSSVLSLEGPGTFTNGQPFVLDQSGAGLELRDSVEVAGAVKLGGGVLRSSGDSKVSGALSLSSDASVEIASQKTLTYSGPEVSIGQNTLTMEGGGKLLNSSDLVLDDGQSDLTLDGIGQISSVRVDADSAEGRGIELKKSAEITTLELNKGVDLSILENAELTGKVKLNSESSFTPSGAGNLSSDIDMAGGLLKVADTRSLPGTLSLSASSEV
ncbi:uncharacterized protein METZ01_LOCUS289651, partial [marine metagenome]